MKNLGLNVTSLHEIWMKGLSFFDKMELFLSSLGHFFKFSLPTGFSLLLSFPYE